MLDDMINKMNTSSLMSIYSSYFSYKYYQIMLLSTDKQVMDRFIRGSFINDFYFHTRGVSFPARIAEMDWSISAQLSQPLLQYIMFYKKIYICT